MDPALPAPWRDIPTLRGRHAMLEPLAREHHDGLCEAVRDSGLDRLWYAIVPDEDTMAGWIDKALATQREGSAWPFVVRDRDGRIVGATRFYNMAPDVPKVLLGYTWYAPHVQRTGVNTETKLMLLRHAFEVLGCVNVSFETSWFNHASRAAIARLGARQDGVLRNARRHSDGSLRDTVVFSILDNEWPAVRRHLQARLDAHP